MAASDPQSFANHRKFVPLYHFVTLGILLLNVLWAAYRLFRSFRFPGRFDKVDSLMGLLVAFALILVATFARTFPLVVQDRVIRMEMRQRLASVLPAELRARIPELSRGQLVALRFAGDGELAELVKKVLDEKITNRDQIKQLIRVWEADHVRL